MDDQTNTQANIVGASRNDDIAGSPRKLRHSGLWAIPGIVEVFVEAVKAGKSGPVIAELINTRFHAEIKKGHYDLLERAAISGKISRMGLKGYSKGHLEDVARRRRKKKLMEEAAQREMEQKLQAKHPSKKKRGGHFSLFTQKLNPDGTNRAPDPWVSKHVEVDVPKDKRVKLISQLRENQCRWPIGNPGDKDFHFCNRDKSKEHAGVPLRSCYCEYHGDAAINHNYKLRNKRLVPESDLVMIDSGK